MSNIKYTATFLFNTFLFLLFGILYIIFNSETAMILTIVCLINAVGELLR